MPVVGVPLPLVSYGGTSIITTFLALGLLLNIQTRRFMLFY
jgi:rod shape determining protein RodA